MADRSKIEWTDATWNPIRGCSRVSEGCRHCYAERQAARFSGPGGAYEGLAIMQEAGHFESAPRWTGEVRFIPELLNQPLHWRRPRKIFVNSMSDLFHEKVLEMWIYKIFAVMRQCPQHIFQILTKRPERMKQYMIDSHTGTRNGGDVAAAAAARQIAKGCCKNIWLGVSVEDQKMADERIPLLLQTPAIVRWVSYEPALGPVDFSNFLLRPHGDQYGAMSLDWLVAGGESGPGARPAHPDWFCVARDQCQAAGVPFFFKQWGEWLHVSQMDAAFTESELDRLSFKTVCRDTGDGDLYFRVGKKRAGALLDGNPWREFLKVDR